MDETLDQQKILDAEHLRLLRIGYFISAGTNLLWVFFPLIYVAFGMMMIFGPLASGGRDRPPEVVGYFIVFIGLAISTVMAIVTTLKFLVGRAIGERRSKGLILFTAAIMCIAIPWGTALGVLTFLVLTRPTIAAEFDRATETP